MLTRKTLALLCLFGFAMAAFAQGQDAKGGKDHPLMSRYEGSRLIAWRLVSYAQVKPLKVLSPDVATERKLDPDFSVEGEVTELFYVAPKGAQRARGAAQL